MFRRILLAFVLMLAVTAAAAPAAPLSSPVHAAPAAAPAAQHPAFFDKTRVVIHLAIAWGVFHHWVWKPYRAGDINLSHKVKLIKAGLALLFAVHEIHKAIQITANSNDDTLKKLNGLLVGAESDFSNIGNLFHKAPSSLTDTQVGTSMDTLNSDVNLSNQVLKAPDAPVSALGNFS